MSEALDAVVGLLDLERIEADVFRGQSPAGPRRPGVCGGLVAPPARGAAGRTVPADRPVHSLHAYFIRGGDPTVPLVYLVDRVRDGKSFTTRRVSAVQHGRPIFTLSASFHRAEPGFSHAIAMPPAPSPESLPTMAARYEGLEIPADVDFVHNNPIDIRRVGPLTIEAARDPALRSTRSMAWIRADGELPDDPLLHVCLVTYASDMTLLDSVLLANGRSWLEGNTIGASLDHAMWFHRPFRADRWLLYVQESPVSAGARGLARGELYTQEGQLVVSIMQEGLVRPIAARNAPG